MSATKQLANPVIDDLRRKLNEVETSFRPAAGESGAFVSTGIDALNQIIRGGGFRDGTVVEWLTDNEGTGASMLAFRAVLPWLDGGGTCVIVDGQGTFYPAPLTALGIDFEQMLIVRPAQQDLFWTLEQALLCRGVSVTAGWFGQAPERVLRRLQLAAEAGGGIGIFFRPAEVRSQPAWAHLRLLATVKKGSGVFCAQHPEGRSGKRLPTPFLRSRIEVLYCQGGKSGLAVEVEVDDETGDVHLVPALAAAGDACQAT